MIIRQNNTLIFESTFWVGLGSMKPLAENAKAQSLSFFLSLLDRYAFCYVFLLFILG